MTAKNVYLTRDDFIRYVDSGVMEDAPDDSVIDGLLESVSRRIDRFTFGRTFYPRVETRKFDVPDDGCIYLDDDLLSLTTLTNGDDTTIASTNYNLLSANRTPYWAVALKPSSSVSFVSDSSSDDKLVIDVLGWWGYRRDYSRDGWESVTTISAAISSTSATTTTLAATSSISASSIIRIDDEMMLVNVASATPSLVRGWNGSTAATHLQNAVVKVWRPQPEIVEAAQIMARDSYAKRNGQAMSGNATVTQGGIILAPESIPNTAREILMQFRRLS